MHILVQNVMVRKGSAPQVAPVNIPTRKPDSVRLGERVAAARAERGWSQQRLAEALGVQPSTLSRYETGVRTFPVSSILRVAELLGVRPDSLLVDPPPVGSDDEAMLREITSAWTVLPDHVKRALVDMVRALAGARSPAAR
jgi:transcriptional regulator with XRE-family HTH domain